MKNSKMKFYALVVFLVGIAIFIGITLATPRAPSASELENFFGDKSCSWPCWQGITPGVTTSSDALQLLQASPVVLKSTVQSYEYEQRPGSGYARWKWKFGKNQRIDASMQWQAGIVRSIILYTRIVSIGEIIDRFGPPEKVSVIIDCATTPEQPQEWCASFYYIKRGYEIRLNWKVPENADDIQFSPSDPISFVYLSEPSALEDRLSYLYSGRDIGDLRDWKGYGNLLELYER